MNTLLTAETITVIVTNPESPFGGVQIDFPNETPILIDFSGGPPGQPGPPGPEGPPGPDGPGTTVPVTTNLLAGDGSGGIANGGIAPAQVVQKQPAYPTPTNSMEIIACLQAAGLCS